MVSITQSIPLRHIVERLEKGREVTILSCNSCAHYCGTGGRLAMDHLAFHLERNGIPVVAREIVTKVCIQEQLRKCDVTDIIVLMACSSGLVSATEVWPEAEIIPTNITLGLGPYDPDRGSATLLFPFPGHEGSKGLLFPGERLEELS
jgi:hypothetical protein